jgi:hypothetical protein
MCCGWALSQPRSGKSGGQRAAVQTLGAIWERWTIATAFGVRQPSGALGGGGQTAKYAKYANGNPVLIFAWFAWFAVESGGGGMDATLSGLMNLGNGLPG